MVYLTCLLIFQPSVQPLFENFFHKITNNLVTKLRGNFWVLNLNTCFLKKLLWSVWVWDPTSAHPSIAAFYLKPFLCSSLRKEIPWKKRKGLSWQSSGWDSALPAEKKKKKKGRFIAKLLSLSSSPSFCPCCTTCRILVPHQGIKPAPLAVKAQSSNHWTAREFPSIFV